MDLPPYNLIATPSQWQDCLDKLLAEPRLAIDLEANSMHAYREQVCLIQISTPDEDFIVDPVADFDLSPLGEIMANDAVEKIFHAAEYDLTLMKREHKWQLNNLFDTMWAARILGYQRYGLASMLEQLYGIELDKRFQKSNWCKRPLSHDQLIYAQLDTHYLMRLRDHLAQELAAANKTAEAKLIFYEQTLLEPSDNSFSPDNFWSVSGAYDLNGQAQAILRELVIFRDQQAERRNLPLFKVMGDKTLLELADKAPRSFNQLRQVYGMSSGQVRRYGKRLLAVIEKGKTSPHPKPPKRQKRPSDDILNRYEKLHTWRKLTAQERGVESDVIISREALWSIARQNPQSTAELATIDLVGALRGEMYGEDILALLQNEV